MKKLFLLLTTALLGFMVGCSYDDTVAENNKIYYTTTDGQKLFPNSTEPSVFGAILQSNIYENGVGVLTFDDAITSIGNMAFLYCSTLASITIPDSVTSIGEYAFYDCKGLTSITIPDSVTSIVNGAFYKCSSLAGITIPDSVTSIGSEAFRECSSLTSITIPHSVTEIYQSAFYYCLSLAKVYCKPTTPPTGDGDMFDRNANGRKIYVPTESVDAYKAAEWWSDYSSAIVGYDF